MTLACASSCQTPGAHATWGECVRAKGLKIGYCRSAAGFDASKQKRWDRDLAAYKAARDQGIQPASTQRRAVEAAVRASNETGVAFQA